MSVTAPSNIMALEDVLKHNNNDRLLRRVEDTITFKLSSDVKLEYNSMADGPTLDRFFAVPAPHAVALEVRGYFESFIKAIESGVSVILMTDILDHPKLVDGFYFGHVFGCYKILKIIACRDTSIVLGFEIDWDEEFVYNSMNTISILVEKQAK